MSSDPIILYVVLFAHIQPENGFCVTNSPTPAPTEPRTDVDCKCSPQEYELLVNDYPLDLAGGSVPVDLHKLCQSNPLETGDGIPGIRTTTEIVDLSSPELTAMCYVCTKDENPNLQDRFSGCDDITREELAVNVIVRVSSFVVCI